VNKDKEMVCYLFTVSSIPGIKDVLSVLAAFKSANLQYHYQVAKLLYFPTLIGGRQRPLTRIMGICFTHLRVVAPCYIKLETISLFLLP